MSVLGKKNPNQKTLFCSLYGFEKVLCACLLTALLHHHSAAELQCCSSETVLIISLYVYHGRNSKQPLPFSELRLEKQLINCLKFVGKSPGSYINSKLCPWQTIKHDLQSSGTVSSDMCFSAGGGFPHPLRIVIAKSGVGEM